MFRHGQRRAQPRISNCKIRCDARGEFPGASVIAPRHGFNYVISKANSPICPACPPHLPLLSTHRALLHGIRMELFTGAAILPTTNNLPSVPQIRTATQPTTITLSHGVVARGWLLSHAHCDRRPSHHHPSQPDMRMIKASPRRKNQQKMTYRFIPRLWAAFSGHARSLGVVSFCVPRATCHNTLCPSPVGRLGLRLGRGHFSVTAD